MKIGIVIEKFDPLVGGAEQWTYQFVRWLQEQKHQVHVVSRMGCAASESLPIILHHVGRRLTRMRFAEAAKEKLGGLELDIVHDMGAGYYCDIFQPHWGSRREAFEQKLLIVHRWLRPFMRMALLLPRYREIFKLSSLQFSDPQRTYIALSKMVERSFHHFHGLNPRHVRLIYNGVDVDAFSPRHCANWRSSVRRQLNVAESDVLLLLIAHNLRLKGLPTTIRAIAMLRREGKAVKLAVVGGKRLSSFERLSVSQGLANDVHFIGPVSDPVPYYSAADIYVHPTFYDPCSLVVLEAMASGLPVITSRFNGVSELLTHGREGYVLNDPANWQELANYLRHLTSQQLRSVMGRAARELAESHLLHVNFQRIFQVYEQVAERKARSTPRVKRVHSDQVEVRPAA